jgi:class 3 adenylate cyclase/HAMP domain-containing protein
MSEQTGKEKTTEPRLGLVRVTFGLRLKIILTFFVISALTSAILAVSTYRTLKRSLFHELRRRVGNLTEYASEMIDKAALKRLLVKMSPDLDEDKVLLIEKSWDFKTLSDQLNRIRETESTIVRFVYIFASTADENKALYVVDADVLEDLALQESGELGEDEEISHFNSEFDISDFEFARRAIKEKKSLVEETYSYDEVFKVNSVSGYAPIFDYDGSTLLAVVGIDMADTDVRKSLTGATRLSLLVTVGALALALATSVVFGTLFTRGIISLDRVVRRFSESDFGARAEVRSNDEVGRLGSSFNQMAETIQRYSSQLESLLKAYGRFVPHDFLRFLKKESILDVKLGDQVQREMTILFSDIRSFSKLSQSMSPKENFNFLNSYLGRVGPEIRAHNGFIDKYIGDGIMALFSGGPDDAVNAAISMRKKLIEYNEHRRKSGYMKISVGIGLHTGMLMLGTVGEEERMDGSVISDAVNLCSRLESLTRLYGGTILASGETLKQLKDPTKYHYRYIDRVQIRGMRGIYKIYEIVDGDPEEQLKMKMRRKSAFITALRNYYGKRFDEAQKILVALNKENPEDMIYLIYLVRCERLINQGIPEGWNGVELIQLK